MVVLGGCPLPKKKKKVVLKDSPGEGGSRRVSRAVGKAVTVRRRSGWEGIAGGGRWRTEPVGTAARRGRPFGERLDQPRPPFVFEE